MAVTVYLKRYRVSGIMLIQIDGKIETRSFDECVYASSKTDATHKAIGLRSIREGSPEAWYSFNAVEVREA